MPGHKNQIAERSLQEIYRHGQASVWHDRSEAGSSTDERTSQNCDGNGGRKESLKTSTQTPIRWQRHFPRDLPPTTLQHAASSTPRNRVVDCSRTLAYRNA